MFPLLVLAAAAFSTGQLHTSKDALAFTGGSEDALSSPPLPGPAAAMGPIALAAAPPRLGMGEAPSASAGFGLSFTNGDARPQASTAALAPSQPPGQLVISYPLQKSGCAAVLCAGRPGGAPISAAAPVPAPSMQHFLPPAPKQALSNEQYRIPSDQTLPPQAHHRVPATPLAYAGFLAAPNLLAG